MQPPPVAAVAAASFFSAARAAAHASASDPRTAETRQRKRRGGEPIKTAPLRSRARLQSRMPQARGDLVLSSSRRLDILAHCLVECLEFRHHSIARLFGPAAGSLHVHIIGSVSFDWLPANHCRMCRVTGPRDGPDDGSGAILYGDVLRRFLNSIRTRRTQLGNPCRHVGYRPAAQFIRLRRFSGCCHAKANHEPGRTGRRYRAPVLHQDRPPSVSSQAPQHLLASSRTRRI